MWKDRVKNVKDSGRIKEIWNREIKKMDGLTFGQKVEYFWDYYKVVFVVLFVVILGVGTIWTMFENSRKECLLSVVVVDGAEQNIQAEEKVEQELLQIVGSGKKYEEVHFDLSPSSNEISGNVVKTAIALSPIEENDIAICNLDTYKKFSEQGGFKSWESVLGENYKKYEPYIKQGAIDISCSEKWQELGLTTYSPAYACVLKEGKHMEQVIKMLEYFF